jgi:hypothetical protein
MHFKLGINQYKEPPNTILYDRGLGSNCKSALSPTCVPRVGEKIRDGPHRPQVDAIEEINCKGPLLSVVSKNLLMNSKPVVPILPIRADFWLMNAFPAVCRHSP